MKSRGIIWIIFTLTSSIVIAALCLSAIFIKRGNGPVQNLAPPFDSYNAAMIAYEPMPQIPQSYANQIAIKQFVEDYKKWSSDCDEWGQRCRGFPIAQAAKFNSADEHMGHIYLFFILDGHSDQDLYVEMNTTPKRLTFWSKAKEGQSFFISGNVMSASVMGPIDTKNKAWETTPFIPALSGNSLIYFNMSDPKITVDGIDVDAIK